MRIITRMRKQKAVWWKRTTPNEFGAFSFEEPVEIMCRWEEAVGQVLGSAGEMVPSKTMVYVDRDMSIGDKLKLGEEDSDTPSDPKDDPLAYEIQGWQKIPTLRATQFLRIATL